MPQLPSPFHLCATVHSVDLLPNLPGNSFSSHATVDSQVLNCHSLYMDEMVVQAEVVPVDKEKNEL